MILNGFLGNELLKHTMHDAPVLADILRQIVELHQPEDVDCGVECCPNCADCNSYRWPCETIEIIIEGLDPEHRG